eukprot:5931670-Pyramimonas_sp.AAC.1
MVRRLPFSRQWQCPLTGGREQLRLAGVEEEELLGASGGVYAAGLHPPPHLRRSQRRGSSQQAQLSAFTDLPRLSTKHPLGLDRFDNADSSVRGFLAPTVAR